MSVEAIVKNAIKDVPKAVAAGVVDMASGMLLGMNTVDSHPQQVIDLLAAATKDLFEGDMISQIENIFKKIRGVDNKDRYFQEVIVSSTNLWHFFGRLKQHPGVVLTVVTRGDANIGMVLMKCREITEKGNL